MASDFIADASERLITSMRALGISAQVAGMVAAEWSAGIVRDWGGDRPYIGSTEADASRERARRDRALLADHAAGERVPLLMRKYSMSRARVYQILESAGKPV